MQGNGHIVWEGASLINGAPILVLLTGTVRPSSNRKTGWMLQTWIIPKECHPTEAIQTGQDESVCGSCVLRGNLGKNRICYVNQMSLGQIYKAYKAGQYTPLHTTHRLSGRDLRIASYGEATALPFKVWQNLICYSRIHTGYTHRWRECDSQWLGHLQASVESVQDKLEANSKGWFTFRIKRSDEPKEPDEVICPASLNPGVVTCQDCGLCNGKQRNITVDVHGIGSRTF